MSATALRRRPIGGSLDDDEEKPAPVIVPASKRIGTRDIVCPECKESHPPDTFSVHIERHREAGEPCRDKKDRLVSAPCAKGCGRHFRLATIRFRRATTTGGWAVRYSTKKGEQLHHESLCDGKPRLPTALEVQMCVKKDDAHGRALAAAVAIEAAALERRIQPLPKSLENTMPPGAPDFIVVADSVSDEGGEDTGEEEDSMMKAKLECPKCQKPYQRGGKRFEKHVEECEGPAKDAGGGRAASKPSTISNAGGAQSAFELLCRRASVKRMEALELRQKADALEETADKLEEKAREVEKLEQE